MNRDYFQIWKKYSDLYGSNTCLFLMVGKFYEMYDSIDPVTGETQTSMKRAVEVLNIQLSIKKGEGPNGHDLLFAGVPEQSLHKFAGILTKNGWTVIVCDQKKNTMGDVVGRPVARILSPGTHFETVGFSAEAPYIACVWLEEGEWKKGGPPSFGATLFDLTTGEILLYEAATSGSADIWSAESLIQFFQIYWPREVLLQWRGDELSRPSEAILRSRLGGYQGLLHIRSGNPADQGTLETAFVRDELLRKCFLNRTLLPTLDYLHIRDLLKAERSLVSLLRFVEDHLPSALEKLNVPQVWTQKENVYLGNNALVQLNMTGQRADETVVGLFTKCLTNLGRREIKERILTPICDTDALNIRLNKIDFLTSYPSEDRKQIERWLLQIYDLPRLHRKLQLYSLQNADILALSQSYRAISHLVTALNKTLFSLSDDTVLTLEKLQTEFARIFDVEKAQNESDDTTFLRKEVSPKCTVVEWKLAECKQEVLETAAKIAKWASLPTEAIRIDTSRDMQVYSLTATKTSLHTLKIALNTTTASKAAPVADISIQVKKSGGGSIEAPFLHQIHGRVIYLRDLLQTELRSELPPVCNAFSDEFSSLWSVLDSWIADLDVSLCIAKVSEANGFCRPELIDSLGSESVFEATGLRHPLIEQIATKVAYVKHTVSLNSEKYGWLIYGMNASGKSSLMKAVGIATLLAQAGAYVPATSFKIRPFKSILTRILNQDNLWAGLSSFAVEMNELRDILGKANENSLVLGDELCSGTESVSATALVASGIQTLLEKKSRFIFATHLHGLSDLTEVKDAPGLSIYHLKVRYDPATDCLLYDRSLHPGPGTSLYGLEVARAMHLPQEFLDRALKIRRKLLGTTVEESATGSHWNRNVVLLKCEVCKSDVQKDLEAHHIRPRAEANGHLFNDGSKRDALSNFAVLCEKCHDKVHANTLQLPQVIQTSIGPQRIIETNISVVTSVSGTSKWSDEEKQIIVNTLRKQPNAPLKRILYQLEEEHGIKISEGTLRKYRQREV